MAFTFLLVFLGSVAIIAAAPKSLPRTAPQPATAGAHSYLQHRLHRGWCKAPVQPVL